MKYILSLSTKPLFVALSTVIGTMAIAFLQELSFQAFEWFIPCFFIIMADLATGIRAARFRGEKIRFSSAARRTISKIVIYICWVLFSVALNVLYGTKVCAYVGMGIVFFIEGVSSLSNYLEPSNKDVSIKSILKIIGQKLGIVGLEDVVIEKDAQKKANTKKQGK